MTKKTPGFMLYVADFLAQTNHLTDAQTGKVIRTLCQQIMGFPPQKLPEICSKPLQNLSALQNDSVEKYWDRVDKNQRAANARWNAKPMPMQCQTDANLTEPNLTEPNNKNNKKQKRTVTALAPPPWVDVELWNGFVESRKLLKKPMTELAKKGIISDLEKLRASGHDPNAALHTSIIRGWAGVFPPKPTAYQRPAEPVTWSNAAEQAIAELRRREREKQ